MLHMSIGLFQGAYASVTTLIYSRVTSPVLNDMAPVMIMEWMPFPHAEIGIVFPLHSEQPIVG